MNARNSSRRAFTLVEVMIAIAILGMVVAAIYATWRAILGATKASQTVAAEVQRSRVALRCLEESLTFTSMFVANARYYWFDAQNGSDAYLSFVAHLPKDFPRSGRFEGFPMRRLQFSMQAGSEGGRELVLRQSLIMREFDEDERNFPLVLMKNVKRFEMEFWDSRKGDWKDEWTETNQVPKLIRIAITTENPKYPSEPGQEYTRIISPAAVAVQAGWQAQGAPPGAPPGVPPGVPPGQPPIPVVPPRR